MKKPSASPFLISPGNSFVNLLWDETQWDLSDQNRVSLLCHAKRLRFCEKFHDNLFMFDFQEYSTVKWKARRHYVSPLNDEMDEFRSQSMPFTARYSIPHARPSLPAVSRPLNSPGLIVPTRLSGYVFTKRDLRGIPGTAQYDLCATSGSRCAVTWRCLMATSCDDSSALMMCCEDRR